MRSWLIYSLVSLLATCPAPCASPIDDLNSAGIKAYRAGNYVEAEKLYNQALEAAKADAVYTRSIKTNLAMVYRKMGKNKEATDLEKDSGSYNQATAPIPVIKTYLREQQEPKLSNFVPTKSLPITPAETELIKAFVEKDALDYLDRTCRGSQKYVSWGVEGSTFVSKTSPGYYLVTINLYLVHPGRYESRTTFSYEVASLQSGLQVVKATHWAIEH